MSNSCSTCHIRRKGPCGAQKKWHPKVGQEPVIQASKLFLHLYIESNGNVVTGNVQGDFSISSNLFQSRSSSNDSIDWHGNIQKRRSILFTCNTFSAFGIYLFCRWKSAWRMSSCDRSSIMTSYDKIAISKSTVREVGSDLSYWGRLIKATVCLHFPPSAQNNKKIIIVSKHLIMLGKYKWK